ncbi:response regulator transcription factor [Photobacterium sp. 1_MG-2023]|uniref:response regulator transcription factor n=1 Tax=Photobacterium sp. 1_MG-2023 TaxID=3062646 RepID=UPI0026E2E155|nr:response regulator transcription factor [Photobacterium sp. 1_MG-2023]MDO6708754.1 response regulator transcription factor [Photobacterium sp. 1_MG-2023]
MNEKTCVILDDHPLVCCAIVAMLKPTEKFTHIQTFTNTLEAIRYIKENQVDMLVIDISLENSDGFEVLRRVKSHGYKGKSLYISGNNSTLYSETAFDMGADGYISKNEDMALIQDAIDAIMNGYSFFKFKKAHEKKEMSSPVRLSNREAIVFQYLIEGKGNKEIAELMLLSPKTISTYKKRVLSKFKVSSIVELMGLNESLLKTGTDYALNHNGCV